MNIYKQENKSRENKSSLEKKEKIQIEKMIKLKLQSSLNKDVSRRTMQNQFAEEYNTAYKLKFRASPQKRYESPLNKRPAMSIGVVHIRPLKSERSISGHFPSQTQIPLQTKNQSNVNNNKNMQQFEMLKQKVKKLSIDNSNLFKDNKRLMNDNNKLISQNKMLVAQSQKTFNKLKMVNSDYTDEMSPRETFTSFQLLKNQLNKYINQCTKLKSQLKTVNTIRENEKIMYLSMTNDSHLNQKKQPCVKQQKKVEESSEEKLKSQSEQYMPLKLHQDQGLLFQKTIVQLKKQLLSKQQTIKLLEHQNTRITQLDKQLHEQLQKKEVAYSNLNSNCVIVQKQRIIKNLKIIHESELNDLRRVLNKRQTYIQELQLRVKEDAKSQFME